MILPGNPRQKVMVPCLLEKLDVLGGVMFLVGATFQANDLKPCSVWLEHSVSLVLCVFKT